MIKISQRKVIKIRSRPRKNPKIIKSLLEKGYDIDRGAILLYDDDIFHGGAKFETRPRSHSNAT